MLDKNQLKFCRKIYWKKQPFIFYRLFDKSRFSDICTIIQVKELNWLCKHTKNVKSSQPCISMNFCTELSKEQVFHVSILNSQKLK